MPVQGIPPLILPLVVVAAIVYKVARDRRDAEQEWSPIARK